MSISECWPVCTCIFDIIFKHGSRPVVHTTKTLQYTGLLVKGRYFMCPYPVTCIRRAFAIRYNISIICTPIHGPACGL